MFGALPWPNSFNSNGFTFGKLLCKSDNQHISDGVVSSYGEEEIHYLFFLVFAAVVLEASNKRWIQAQGCHRS